MTIKHMKIFITVYQEMSVTRAAELLHMTQPAVTRSIRELEKYYGIRLFERLNHRLYRTESGTALYMRALHIAESFDALEKDLKNWDEAGILRLGSTITIGNFILPSLISDFQKKHPKLQLHVMISNCAKIQQAVLDNQIDLALIEGACGSDSIYSELLMQDHLCLIMAPDHPLNKASEIYMKDLKKYPLLCREEGSAGRDYLDNVFGFHRIPLTPAWESVSSSALIKAVAQNLGISILPEKLVREAIKAGSIVTRKVEDESFVRDNYIIWHKQKFLTPPVEKFIEMCRCFAGAALTKEDSCGTKEK